MIAWLRAAGVVLLLTAAGRAKAEGPLTPQHTPGTVSTVEESQQMTAKVVIGDQNVELSGHDRWKLRAEVLPPIDGKVAIRQTLESGKLDANAAGQAFQFDTAAADSPKTGNDDFDKEVTVAKALVGNPLTYVLESPTQVARIEGLADLIRKTPGNDVPYLQTRLTEQRLQEEYQQKLQRLPDGAVQPGDTWQRIDVLYLSGGSSLSFDRVYEYVGPSEKNGRSGDQVKSRATGVRLTLGANDIGLTLKESKLEVKSSEGEYFFDRQRGEIVDSRTVTRIVGPATLQAGGNDLPLELDMTLTVERRVTPVP